MKSLNKISHFTAVLVSLLTLGFLNVFAPAIQAQDQDLPSLHEAYEGKFLIGTALNRAQIYAQEESTEEVVRADRRGYFYRRELLTDPQGLELARKHFNAVTPENVMKWEEIHPAPNQYDFEAADKFVEFAEANDMFIVAHTLIWHNQTPEWVFKDHQGNDVSREVLLERMRDHIHTIVGRYKGRIHAWDVVNEAVNDDGSLRESGWYRIIGEEFLQKAFEFAREADPDAELYYNDYRLEQPAKLKGVMRLVQNLLKIGAPVTGLGTQSHYGLNHPTIEQVDSSLTEMMTLGIDVMVTELDINVLPSGRQNGELNYDSDIYQDGLPEDVQEQLTQRYRELFELYLKHSDNIKRVTLWGVADEGSWLNYLPMERTNYPLLFDRENKPKPAFEALIELGNK